MSFIEVDSIDQFDEETAGVPHILYFSAPWCGPCKQFGPQVKNASSKVDTVPVFKINVDELQSIGERYNVSSIPTLVVVDSSGTEVGRRVGTVPPSALLNLFKDAAKN